MSEQVYSISEIREQITRLPEQFEEDPTAVAVTRHGKKVMSILPSQQYDELLKQIAELQETIEAYQETLEVMQDEELMEGIRQGMKDIEEGRITPLDDVLKELGWK